MRLTPLLFVTLTAVSLTSAPALAQAPDPAPLTQERSGFWANVGFGYGSLGCQDCDGREGGLSGGLSLGRTVSDRLLLGIGTTGWTKEVAGERLSVGTLDFRVRFYPVASSGFFITG